MATQRAAVMALLLACVIGPALWFGSRSALLALRQPPVAVEFAAQYLRSLAITLPIHALFDSGARFLWAQNVLWCPPAIPNLDRRIRSLTPRPAHTLWQATSRRCLWRPRRASSLAHDRRRRVGLHWGRMLTSYRL